MSDPTKPWDEITLPRSGVVLTRQTVYEDGAACYSDPADHVFVHAYADGLAMAGCCSSGMDADAPIADAIAWADAKVLALRAALMPKDARERIVKVLVDMHTCSTRGYPRHWWEREMSPTADAVLRALGIAP